MCCITETTPIQLSMTVAICDQACENQLCERKLYQIIFLLISSALNVVFHFRRKPIKFCSTDTDFVLLVLIVSYDRVKMKKSAIFLH